MGTYKQWRESPWPLPVVDLGGFSAATIGVSLSALDGRRVISVVVDEHDGTAVVLALTDAQIQALDASPDLEDETRSEFARVMAKFQRWLDDLDLDDNDVIGKQIDPVFAGFVLGAEPPVDEFDQPPTVTASGQP